MKVIVTDASERQALAVIRSLGRKGILITATIECDEFEKNYPIGAKSKYCHKLVVLPSSKENQREYLSELIRLSDEADVFIPISTSTIEIISKNIHLFPETVKIPLCDYSKIYLARNKEKILQFAESQGIPVPKTYYCKDIDDLDSISREIFYPSVIKFRDEKGLGWIRYQIVQNPTELKEKFLEMHKVQEYPLIQEYVGGEGIGFFALFNNNSEPRAIFCHKRIREYPITGGQSSFCISVRNERVIDYGLKLLKALNWYGIAMVEFKMDLKDGKPKLMEINPRFWGSTALAIESGVDFPILLVKMAIEGDIPPIWDYKLNEKLRFFTLDIKVLKTYIKSDRPSKIRFVLNFLYDLMDLKVHDGIFTRDDPEFSLNKNLKELFIKIIRGRGK